MNLLVTGGAGFIGANFIDYWLDKYTDDSITNLDAMTYCANPLTVERHKAKWGNRYVHIKGNILNSELLSQIVPNVNTIVHFAAETHVDRSIDKPDVFLNTNVLGTHNLLKHALQNENIHFHHVSTDEVYGALELNTKNRFNEKTTFAPRSPYAASKASSDHIVHAYHETYGLKTTISNCSNNYGPYQFPEKAIPLFLLRASKDQLIPIYGDGESVRDYLYVKDHCKAIDTIIHNGNPGETYCVGGDNELNTKELVSHVLDITGKDDNLLKFTKDRKGHDRRYAIDHSKITNELEWSPTVKFEDGLEQTAKWYFDNKDWWMPMWKEAKKVAKKYLGN